VNNIRQHVTSDPQIARSKHIEYFGGFDYLRVCFATAIVAWHVKLFGPVSIFQADLVRPSLPDIIYFNLCLVGVPLFFQISIFLYIFFREKKPNYFVRRMRQLLLVYLFLIVIDRIINKGHIGSSRLTDPAYWMLGGIDSDLWFLFSLMILIAVAELVYWVKNRMDTMRFLWLQFVLFAISISLYFLKIPLLSYIPKRYHVYHIKFTNTLDFLPYVFLAFIVVHYYKNGKISHHNQRLRNFIISMFIAYVLTSISEWILSPRNAISAYYNCMLPILPYARISVLIGVITILLIFIMRDYSPPRIISECAKLTLGIYIIHYFIVSHFDEIFRPLLDHSMVFQIPLIEFLLVFISSVIITYCLKYERVV